MPRCTVIPVLAYPNVEEAAEWLCEAFGFTVRLRIGGHRAQLNVGDGAIVLAEHRSGNGGPVPNDESSDSVMVRVEDVDRHHERAARHGASILQPPADYPYGERQYTAADHAGRQWKFTQTVKDVAPEDWGGASGQL
jgi:uncharacterized glyoxalase superfamily protein PhnB